MRTKQTKILKLGSLVIVALCLTLLDISLFSFLAIHDVSIISSYAVLIIFALSAAEIDFVVMSLSVFFFFTIFSSLPLWLVFSLFFLYPAMLTYLRHKHIPDLSVGSAALFIIFSEIIFEFLVLAGLKNLGREGIISAPYFITINSLFGIFVYAMAKKIWSRFSITDIKL